MRLNRTQNTIRNMLSGTIVRIVQIVFPFVIRTAFIYTLGIEYLGLNSLFTSILSVLSLTELGVGSALVFSMYKPIAEGDDQAICALMNLYKKSYRVIGCVIAIIGLALIPFLPKLIEGDIPSDINLYVIYLINLLGTVITYFLFAYKNCLFEAHQRNDIVSKLSVALSLVQYTVQIIVLIIIRNYYAYLIVSPLVIIARNITIASIADRKYPRFRASGEVDKQLLKGIKKRISALVMYKVGGIVLNSVDNIVISAFLGLSILAIYNNYYYLISALFGFLAIITGSMLAGVGNSVVTDSVEKNYKDFNRFLFIQLWIISWCAITLFCLYQPFMYLWVGEKLMFSLSTAFFIALLFYVWRMGDIVGLYKEALGMWHEDRFRPLIGAVVNLVINIILVQVIGINGIVISSIISILLITFPFAAYVLFKNYFKRSPASFYILQTKHFAATLACGAVTFFCCEALHSLSVLSFFAKFGICIIVPNTLMLLIYCRTSRFKEAKAFVVSVIRGIRK